MGGVGRRWPERQEVDAMWSPPGSGWDRHRKDGVCLVTLLYSVQVMCISRKFVVFFCRWLTGRDGRLIVGLTAAAAESSRVGFLCHREKYNQTHTERETTTNGRKD